MKKSCPYPSRVLSDGMEVIAWPDGTVGLHWPAGFGRIYSPTKARALAKALIAMAKKAKATP